MTAGDNLFLSFRGFKSCFDIYCGNFILYERFKGRHAH